MADRFRNLTVVSLVRRAFLRGVSLATVALVAVSGSGLRAQSPEAAAYPVDPVAAAGMTSGLPNGVTMRQAEMMQVRTSAQGAQGEASAASLARSADQSIEERNREIALQTARTNKAIKDEMRNRLKFEQASSVQQKVTASDMSTWKQNGGVRVERNVPDAFITSLIAEEEAAAARGADSGEKKRFSLFGGHDDSSDSDGGGFLSSIRPPRLPFMGGGASEGGEAVTTAASAPSPSDNSEPVFAQNSSSRSSSPSPAPAGKPGVIPQISGAALVDGRSPVNPNQTPAASQTVSFADETPEPEKKKASLFSKLGSGSDEENSLVPTSSESGGGGFFGFGKKKASVPVGIDASLFPEGSAGNSPIGNRLPSGSTTSMASASEPAVPPSRTVSAGSSGSIELPGQTVEKSRGLSLPKPNLSLPSIPTLTKSGSSGGGSAAAGYHVVSSTAQFMVYGADQMKSEIRALPAGTTVLVTKPGEQWAGIRLTDGTEGIVQNKNLRPASGGDSGASGADFATSPGQ